MAYSAVGERRMPFDIDGTEVGYRYMATGTISQIVGQGVESWLTSIEKQYLNREDRLQSWGATSAKNAVAFWFFFPESREVNKIGFQYPSSIMVNPSSVSIQGSNNTTNGMDGTWEEAVYTYPDVSTDLDYWRNNIFTVSFSGPVKVLRICLAQSDYKGLYVCGLHVYGQKAATAQPDDLLFCDTAGNELTALIDFGDQPEGTTEVLSFKVKNASADKIANDVNLQLNHDDFAMSFSATGPWTSVLDIAQLGAGALSSTIYVRNALEPPLLTLGPKAARVIATVGSWT